MEQTKGVGMTKVPIKTALIFISGLYTTVIGAATFTPTCDDWMLPCEDGAVIVDCGVDLCALEDCPDDKLCHTNHCWGCHTVCCDPCETDTFTCDNGLILERDPALNCEFPKCPSNICGDQRLLCPNGYSYVERDPENDCDWEPCPSRHVPKCYHDTSTCPFDVPMVDNCEVEPCSNPAACNVDETCVKNLCGNCYELCCTDEEMDPCNTDEFTCPDGSVVQRNPDMQCAFECPETSSTGSCVDDQITCADGRIRQRNSETCCFNFFDICVEKNPVIDAIANIVCITFGTGYK